MRRRPVPTTHEGFAAVAAFAPVTMVYGPWLSDSERQTVLDALVFACDAQAVLRDMAPAHRKQARSIKIAEMLTLIHRLHDESAPEEGDGLLRDADVLLLLDALSQWRENEAREVPDPLLQKLVEEALRRNLPW